MTTTLPTPSAPPSSPLAESSPAAAPPPTPLLTAVRKPRSRFERDMAYFRSSDPADKKKVGEALDMIFKFKAIAVGIGAGSGFLTIVWSLYAIRSMFPMISTTIALSLACICFLSREGYYITSNVEHILHNPQANTLNSAENFLRATQRQTFLLPIGYLWLQRHLNEPSKIIVSHVNSDGSTMEREEILD